MDSSKPVFTQLPAYAALQNSAARCAQLSLRAALADDDRSDQDDQRQFPNVDKSLQDTTRQGPLCWQVGLGSHGHGAFPVTVGWLDVAGIGRPAAN